MNTNTKVAPVLKWVGGKRQLLNELCEQLPKDITSYCEPFVGGGALLFALQPQKAVINDINQDLICVYETIKDNVDELIEELQKFKNTEKSFYRVRAQDRNHQRYEKLSNVKKAARILYLNKTCFNGLYRVNSLGEFNAPYGYYKNPNIVNEEGLRAVSEYFKRAQIQITSQDFAKVLEELDSDTFVYLDPPYDPVNTTSNFTNYAKDGFIREDQIKLKQCCDELNKRGIKFMLSNSATDFIKDLYSNYNVTIVKAKRAINSVGSKRGSVDEVIIRNYE